MGNLFEFLRNKKISVISVAGKINPIALDNAINFFQQNSIFPQIMPHVYDDESDELYLASSLKNRLEDFYNAWNISDIIICSRGGYGCSELAEQIDWNQLTNNPIVIGYSDITALHLAMLKNKKGIPVSGMMFLKFNELSLNHLNTKSLYQSLTITPEDVINLKYQMKIIKQNEKFCGEIISANLTVLTSLCGTNLLPNFKGKVLLIEDINEAAYKIDRCLTQLWQNGIFHELSGLIFGEFGNSISAEELDYLINKFSAKIPNLVARNFPFGHGKNIYSINLNAKYYI